MTVKINTSTYYSFIRLYSTHICPVPLPPVMIGLLVTLADIAASVSLSGIGGSNFRPSRASLTSAPAVTLGSRVKASGTVEVAVYNGLGEATLSGSSVNLCGDSPSV